MYSNNNKNFAASYNETAFAVSGALAFGFLFLILRMFIKSVRKHPKGWRKAFIIILIAFALAFDKDFSAIYPLWGLLLNLATGGIVSLIIVMRRKHKKSKTLQAQNTTNWNKGTQYNRPQQLSYLQQVPYLGLPTQPKLTMQSAVPTPVLAPLPQNVSQTITQPAMQSAQLTTLF